MSLEIPIRILLATVLPPKGGTTNLSILVKCRQHPRPTTAEGAGSINSWSVTMEIVSLLAGCCCGLSSGHPILRRRHPIQPLEVAAEVELVGIADLPCDLLHGIRRLHEPPLRVIHPFPPEPVDRTSP